MHQSAFIYSCQKSVGYGTNMSTLLFKPWLTGQITPIPASPPWSMLPGQNMDHKSPKFMISLHIFVFPAWAGDPSSLGLRQVKKQQHLCPAELMTLHCLRSFWSTVLHARAVIGSCDWKLWIDRPFKLIRYVSQYYFIVAKSAWIHVITRCIEKKTSNVKVL